MQVEFEEDEFGRRGQQNFSVSSQNRGLIGFLIKTGLAKDQKGAEKILLAVLILVLIVIVIILARTFFPVGAPVEIAPPPPPPINQNL